MTPGLNPYKAAPGAMKALVLEMQENELDHSLIDLVKTRALQINGCAYRIHMHTSEARAAARPRSTSICSTHGLNQARHHFSETELVNLTPCVAAINAWNRIAISFRSVHPMHRTRGA